MSPIIEYKAEKQNTVALWQCADLSFIVTYGHETRDRLTYTEAAEAFGSCCMHAATCAGLIEKEEQP